MPKINLHILFQYLEKNNIAQLQGLIALRIDNPQAFQKRAEILFKELTLDKGTSFAGCNLLEGTSRCDFGSGDEEIFYLSGAFPKMFDWEELKELTKRLYTQTKSEQLTFFFGDKTCLKGKLIDEQLFQQELILVSIYEGYQNKLGDVPPQKIVFMDEKIDKREWNLKKQVKANFWQYQFISNNRKYLVLSEERIDLEYGTIEGSMLSMEDFTIIGQNTRLKVQTPILFLNKWHSSSGRLKSKRKLIEFLEKLNIDRKKYFNYLFLHPNGNTYNHPDYFQELVSAFLLSSKINYPLHLFIMAITGSGKSYLEQSIHHKFDEDSGIVEGSCSKMKGLVPSFKGNLPEAGALLSSNRICVIDEFLRILMDIKSEEREVQLTRLNPILEHTIGRANSGNGSISMNPTCRTLMVSNPIYGASDMESLCKKIDNSFLGRVMIWFQGKEHIDFIQKRKGLEKNIFKIDKEDWLGIVDFMHSFTSEFDKERVMKVFNQGLISLGLNLEENPFQKIRNVYSARYQEHILKLMDGIIKTRCLYSIEHRFKAIEKDYLLLENLWHKMLENWYVFVSPSISEDTLK